MRDPDCIFCKIVAGELPSTIVDEDERTIAFMDIAPATRGPALVILSRPRASGEVQCRRRSTACRSAPFRTRLTGAYATWQMNDTAIVGGRTLGTFASGFTLAAVT